MIRWHWSNCSRCSRPCDGEAALRVGIRQSPVFVGERSFVSEIVHYIAPSEELVDGMFDALRGFEARTRGANPV